MWAETKKFQLTFVIVTDNAQVLRDEIEEIFPRESTKFVAESIVDRGE